MINPYIRQNPEKYVEDTLYESLIIESIQMYGQDVVYIPRKMLKRDPILNENLNSLFNDSFTVEMYLQNVEGFEGDGKLLERFGLEVRDEATFIVSNLRWNQLINEHGYENNTAEPKPGDLIYLPMSDSLFEIRYVDSKKPFFQFANLPTFNLVCELFEYTSEDIDTDNDKINAIQDAASTTTTFLVEEAAEFNDNETLIFATPNGETGSTEFFFEETDMMVTPPEYTIVTGPLTFDGGKEVRVGGGTTFTGVESGKVSVVVRQLTSDDSNDAHFRNTDTVQNNEFAKDNLVDFVDFSESNPFGDPFNSF